MLPFGMPSGRLPHATRTAMDHRLMERTDLDEFSLRRLRKSFMVSYVRLPYTQKRALADGGTCPRFTMMVAAMRELWPEEHWNGWLTYMEHSQRDVEEMCRGEYPISPYLIRVFSTLFGIKVDFLLLGSTPSVDKIGASIDVWPMTGTR